MTLACPDCGSALTLSALKNGTHVCQCLEPFDGCRADWLTGGKTVDEAADKFVRKCEQFGYVTALAAKLEGMNQEAK